MDMIYIPKTLRLLGGPWIVENTLYRISVHIDNLGQDS